MADYWKSNAKKFCEVCKCWFADNKLSVEHHERGARHKAMVQNRLRELSKNAETRDRENASLAATLAQMESAAIASMSGRAGAGSGGVVRGAPGGIGPMMTGDLDGKTLAAPAPKLSAKEEARAKLKAEKERLKNLKRTAKQSTLWRDDEEEPAASSAPSVPVPPEAPELAGAGDYVQWTQAYSAEGVLYYYNFYTGETSYSPPPNSAPFLTWDQYQAQFAAAGYNFESSASLEEYAQPPPPPTTEPEEAPKPAKLSRWDPIPSGEEPASKEEPKVEPEPEDDPQFAPTAMKLEFEPEPLPQPEPEKRSAGGLLGGWVAVEPRVVKEEKKAEVKEAKEKINLTDLPAEATQIQELAPTFDEIEAEALTFEEKKAPIATKKPKVIEFKKRTKTIKSARVRDDTA
uniref:WW domain-binding protein 4 n=1 Tax=Panagrellus redivivus TaxID=6233 RepID=A0A7E4W5C5_PANRE